ncbi:M56 family metallopeptidase [Streptomyces sp. NPDC001515]
MGVFVLLPLVLPVTAWPVAHLASARLHPRTATRLLTAVGVVMAACSTLCLALLVVAGTAQLPGNPLPDGWSSPAVRAVIPHDEAVGIAAIPVLLLALASSARVVSGHYRVRRRAHRALARLRPTAVVVLPDERPYAHALPGRNRGRVVVSTAMLGALRPRERRALFAHERAHLTGHHHRYVLAARLAARCNPFLRPLCTAVSFTTERWADEEAAQVLGDRAVVARAIGRAALFPPAGAATGLPAMAAPGQVPRRMSALLAPAPAARSWPSLCTGVGIASWAAGAGTVLSALSSANSTITLLAVLRAATPM